ncbi:MAG: DUF4166 domain-containing protein [Gammaproteobacteria bacterium]
MPSCLGSVSRLGAHYDELPRVTRRIHEPDPVLLAEGQADVEGAETAAGRLLARIFGFPEAGRNQPVRVVIETMPDGSERRAGVYPTRTMRSVMTRPDPATQSIGEHFGSFQYRNALELERCGLASTPMYSHWYGIPLPRWLLPSVEATERASADRHRLDVCIAMPLVGRLVRYRGRLQIR